MTHSFKENLMTTKDASELSGYTSDYLARLVRSGEIQGKRIGHSWVIDSASLEAFMTKQQGRKLDRARELASSRVREYNKHNQFVRRTTRALTEKISIPKFSVQQVSLRSHSFALGVAVMVVALGAVGAHAAAVPQVVARASALATEISSGFVDTFGIVPSRIAARMEEARTAVRADATRDVLASRRAGYVASPVLAAIDLETLRSVLVKEYRAPRTASGIASSPSRADAPILTAADVHASAVTAYAFLAHPASIGAALTDAYFAIGTDAYAAVDASFSAYRALVDDSGVAALALAATTRDTLARAPHAVAQVNLALGEAVVSATHAAIRTDVIVAHGLATAAPESARIAVTLMGSAGDTLARAAEQVPARVATAYLNAMAVPAVLAPRLAQAIFGAEYAVASRFVSATSAVSERYLALVEGTGSLAYESSSTTRSVVRSVSRAVAFAPAAIEDATLGALGKSAMALDSVTHLSSFAAVLPALSASEKTALAVYEAIHSVFDSANRSLVAFFSTTPETVLPTGVPKARVIAVATSTRPVASGTQPVTTLSYPTYTTVVRGVSEDFMNQSLASLRTNVLATVASMIQPVSSQVVQNITTIQQLNRIDSLHDLVVENGDFRNSIFDSGIRVSAADGYFSRFTAGTTTLATTTVNGTLTISSLTLTGSLSSPGSITGSHFVSTSTNATSTFAGSINIDNAGLVYATSTRNVGIGVLSPAALLAVQNSTSTQPIFVASNAAGAEVYRLTDAGFVGIGTTSPTYNLAVEGSSSLGTQAIAGYFTATTSTATSAFAGSLAVGTSSPFGSGLLTVGTSSPLLYISSNTGRIGIGTTSPRGNLEISASTLPVFTLNTLNTTSGGIEIHFDVAGVTKNYIWQEYIPASGINDIAIGNGSGATAVRFGTGGEVSVGAGAPGYIYATSTRKLSVQGFGATNATYNTYLTNSAGTALMVIRDDGNVGIGTTSPSGTLAVSGDFFLTGSTTVTGAGSGITFTGSGNHDITASGGTLRIGTNTIIGNIEALDDTVDIGTAITRFDKIYANEVNASTIVGTLTGGNLSAETFTINSDNATADTESSYLVFERGTITPNASLSWNAAESAKRFEFNHPLFIQNASASTTLTTLDLKSVAGQIADIFRVASSSSDTLFNVTASGNVGIGTTSPYAKLSVAGPVVAEYFHATSSSATSTFAGGLSAAGQYGLNVMSAGANTQFLFGTTTGATAAHEGGPYMMTYDFTNTLGYGLAFVLGTTSVPDTAAGQASSIFSNAFNGATGLYLRKYSTGGGDYFVAETSTGAPIFNVKSAGNVGIGIAAPTSKLHLYGASGATDLGLTITNGDLANIFFRKASGVNNKLELGSTNQSIGFFTNNVENMTLNTTGNLAINGTTGTTTIASGQGFTIGTSQFVLQQGSGRVGIGTATPGAKLEVVGSADTEQLIVKAYSSQTLANPILQLQTSAGAELMRITTDNINNIFIGQGAGLANTVTGSGNEGLYNTFVGSLAGDANTTGEFNSTFGYLSLSANTTGDANTAMGVAALSANTEGSSNTSIGYGSLTANTTGSGNTAVGRGALETNSTAGSNTAFGQNALRLETSAFNAAFGTSALANAASTGFNTGIGTSAGFSNTTGNKNTLLGYAADYYNQTGSGNTVLGYLSGGFGSGGANSHSNNTVIGYQSGYNLSTGGNNIYLGSYTTTANANITTGSNNIIIGNDIQAPSATGSNQLNIGNLIFATGMSGTGSTIAGNVGIGTTTPALGRLVIPQSAEEANVVLYGSTSGHRPYLLYQSNDGAKWRAGFRTTDANSYLIRDEDAGVNVFKIEDGSRADALTIRSTNAPGTVGIGTTTPWGNLSVTGLGTGTGYTFVTANSSNTPTFVIQDNGNVGIGTTDPQAKLDVNGDFHLRNTSAIHFATGLGGDNNWMLGYESSPSGALINTAGAVVQKIASGAPTTGYMIRNGAGTSLFEIQGSDGKTYIAGNVGIGTTSPDGTLDVSQNVSGGVGGRVVIANRQADAANNAAQLAFKATSAWTAGVYSGKITSITGGGSNSADMIFSTWNGATGAVDVMTLKNTGNVGIGTTSPWGLLSVNPNGITGPAFVVGSSTATNFIVTNGGNVGIGTASPSEKLTLQAASGSNTLAIRINNGDGTQIGSISTDNTLKLKLDGYSTNGVHFPTGFSVGTAGTYDSTVPPTKGAIIEGNVGIGTTGPGAPLHVVGTALNSEGYSANSNLILRDSRALAAGTGGGIVFQGIYSVGGAQTTGAGIWASKINATGGEVGYDLKFATRATGSGDLATRMVIDNAGNIGIGTTTPVGKLDIKADSGNVGINSFRVPDNSGAFTGGTVGTWLGFSRYNDATAFGGAIGVNNSQEFRIQSASGEGMGINLTTGRVGIDYSLSIDGAGSLAAPSLALDDTVGDETGFYLPALNTIGFITDRLERVRIDSVGNVGIGTTNPGTYYSVASRLDVKGVSHTLLNVDAGSAGSTSGITFSEAGTAKWALSSRNSFTGAADRISFLRSEANGSNEVFTILQSGNVGIGTTEPGDKLHILSGTGNIVFGSPFSGYGGIGFQSTLTTVNYALLGNAGETIVSRPAGGTLKFNEGNGAQMVILPTSGNVGIGTTSPGSLLSVHGTGYISSSLFVGGAITATSTLTLSALGTPAGTLLATDANGTLIATSTIGVANLSLAKGNFLVGNDAGIAQATSTIFISSTGNVGVGDTSPSAKLDVMGTSGSTSSIFNVASSTGVAFLTVNAVGGITVASPYSDTSGNNASFVKTMNSSVFTNAGGGQAFNIKGAIENIASGSIGGGNYASIIGTTNVINSGTSYGYVSANSMYSGGAGTPSAVGNFIGYLSHGSGTAFSTTTNQYDFRADNFSGSGAITNRYGLYLGFNNTGVTNAYGVYQSSNTLTNYFAGNVGIGTTSPSAKLSVKGDGTTTGRAFVISDSGDVEKLTVLDNGNVDAVGNAQFGAGGVGNRLNIGYKTNPSGSGDIGLWAVGGGSLHIEQYNAFNIAQAGSSRFYIKDGGNVGIGTTTPSANPTGGGTALAISGTGAGVRLNPSSGGWAYTEFLEANTAKFIMGHRPATGNFSIVTGGTLAAGSGMTMTTDGYVGFGTLTPTSMLHIVAKNNTWTDVTNPEFELWGVDNETEVMAMRIRDENDNEYFRVSSTGVGNADKGKVYIAGNVGIGTTSPGVKLQVTAANSESMSLGTAAGGIGVTSINGSGKWGLYMGSGDSGKAWIQVGRVDGTATAYDLSLQANGGNVGIGTTSPSALLSLGNGAGAAGTTAALGMNFGDPLANLYRSAVGTIKTDGIANINGILIGNGVSGSSNGLFRFDGVNQSVSSASGGSLYLERDQGNNVYIGLSNKIVAIGNNSGSSLLTVNGGASIGTGYTGNVAPTDGLIVQGNVGIGTTGPVGALHIANATTRQLLLNRTEIGTALTDGTYFSTAGGNFEVINQESGYIRFYTNGADVMRLDSTGNVGIGTTTPTSSFNRTLNVNDTASGGNAAFVLSQPTKKYSLAIVNTDFRIYDETASAYRLNIDTNGKIGIGTITPQFTLSFGNQATNGTLGWQYGSNAASRNWGIATDLDAFGGLSILTSSAKTDGLLDTTRMFISSAGNVGIGTTSPAALLAVQGNSYVSGTSFFGGAIVATSTLSVGGTENTNVISAVGGTATLVLRPATSAASAIGNIGAHDLAFITGNANKIYIQNTTGNVGIGTVSTAAASKLGVAGGVGIGSTYATGNAAPTNGLIVEGNVGIGTTTPAKLLSVGNSAWGEYIRVGHSGSTANAGIGMQSASSYGFTIFSDGDAVATFARTHGGLGIGTTYSETASPTGGLIVEGNVGIGTTAPGYKLEVQGGQVYSPSGFVVSTGASGTSIANGYINVRGDGVGGYSFIDFDSSAGRMSVNNIGNAGVQIETNAGIVFVADNLGNIGIGTTSPFSRLSVTGAGTGTGRGFSVANSSNVDNFYVLDNGNAYMKGNIGIGTTSPATKLEVGGNTANVTFDGYLNCAGFTSDANGKLACTASDQRLKQNITSLATSSVLMGINALNPVSFIWRDPSMGSQQQFGLIAQQVQEVFPNLVQMTNPTELTPDGTLTVNYPGFISPMILAIQELDARTRQILGSGGVLSIVPGVESQCVTGDTRLRRRRRRADGSFESDEVDIKDIAAGDEIQSLDERTGRVVYSRVNALMDMGEQEVYELVTKSGRRIRTTANHPYLARERATNP